MLNFNKIHSDMNRYNIRLTDLARLGDIKYTSLKDRFKKQKLYAAEVEMIAEYFGSCHVSSADGCLKSPFTIIAEALTLDFMVLPVLLFFQYVFLNDRFALNVRISR